MSALPLSARSAFFLLTCLCSFSSGDAWAQQDAWFPVGSRVRVWTQADAKGRPTGLPVEGWITTWTADFVVVDNGSRGGAWAGPRARVSRLDVHRGRESVAEAAFRGGAVGLLIGGGIGLGLGYALSGNESSSPGHIFAPSRGESALFAGALLGGVGVIFGAGAGGTSAGDRWQQIPLLRRLSVTPHTRGMSFSTSLSF